MSQDAAGLAAAHPTPSTVGTDSPSGHVSGAGWAALVVAIGVTAASMVLALVPSVEGLVLWGYRDPAGIVTACVGHTGPGVVAGARYTPAQCAEWLASDLVKHAADLECINAPLAPHQRAALLSFAFNVGPGAPGIKDGLCRLKSGQPSTLRRRAEAGDFAGMCAALSDWVFVAGRDCRQPDSGCRGIPLRRAAERAMCEGKHLTPTVGSAATSSSAAVPGTP